MPIAVTIALGLLALLMVAFVTSRAPAWGAGRRWRKRLAGPEDDLTELFLGCDLFDLELPAGRMRDDPALSQLLSLVRAREYQTVARQFAKPLALESFLVAAERRMGGTGRPISMDYGYLQDVIHELADRQTRPGGPTGR